MFNIFKDKKILITGHTGFKGSWLGLWLSYLGAKVSGIALDPKTPFDFFNVCKISELVSDYRADIRDFATILKLINEIQPDIVIHLAAQPLVLESYKNPLFTYETNAIGTANILEAIRQTDFARSVLIITTDKVYENQEIVWGYRENDPLGGYEPYGTSKAAAEMIIKGYRNSFFNPESIEKHGVNLITARAGNVIGGGDWSENRIVPDCVRFLRKNEHIIVRNPHAIRPWQFVLEALGGYLMVLSKSIENPGKFCEEYNFGPGLNGLISVQTLVEQLINNWGSGHLKIQESSNKPYESGFLALDISKARLKLGWQPSLDLNLTVEWTVAWYKNFHENNKIRDFSINQILEFQSLWEKTVQENKS